MENMEFKKWVQTQIKISLVPIFNCNGFKKGRTNCFVRERTNIVQFLKFEIKQFKVRLYGGISPIYFPLQALPYYRFKLSANESHLCANGINVPILIHSKPIVTPETISQWAELESIILDSIFPQFDEISNLNELMSASDYDVPDNDVWNGIKWYAQGVYKCLSGDFKEGVEQLKEAYLCKQGYLKYVKDTGCTFDPQKDQLAAIFYYIDLLHKAMLSNCFSKESFLDVYECICSDSKKWYKL